MYTGQNVQGIGFEDGGQTNIIIPNCVFDHLKTTKDKSEE